MCHPSPENSHILKKFTSAEGLEFAVNHPPATLFDQFLKERLYLKNVTPRTLVWYRVAFNSYRAMLGSDAAPLPTRASLQQFLVQLRDRGIRPVTCNIPLNDYGLCSVYGGRCLRQTWATSEPLARGNSAAAFDSRCRHQSPTTT
jgi:hypothetical protein